MFLAGVRAVTDRSQRNYAFYKYLLRVVAALGGDSAKEAIDLLRSVEQNIGSSERASKLALLQLDNEVDTGAKMAAEKWDGLVAAYWSRWSSKASVVTELEGVVAGDEGKRSRLDKLLEEKRHTAPVRTAQGFGSRSDLADGRELVSRSFARRADAAEGQAGGLGAWRRRRQADMEAVPCRTASR